MSAFAEQIANILSFNKTTPEIFIQRELFIKTAKGGAAAGFKGAENTVGYERICGANCEYVEF